MLKSKDWRSKLAKTPSREEELIAKKLEKTRREKARRSYRAFRTYLDPKFIEAPHNIYLAEKLEDVEAYVRTGGKEGINRLIAQLPPQYGKSKDIARNFVAWFLGRNPNCHVAIVSYAANLADKHSAYVRDLVKNDLYQNVFGKRSVKEEPVDVDEKNASRNDWSIGGDYSGGCISRGIGGGLSGHPVDLLIIDDPTPDIDTARSKNHQSELQNWMDSVGIPRMSEFGAIILVHTRWDSNDLIGQQLKKMAGGDPNVTQWDVVFLPELALEKDEYPSTPEKFRENLSMGFYIPMGGDQLGREPGQCLWPARYSQVYVERKKADAEPSTFAAVDQQLPRPFTGGFFDERDVKILDPMVLVPTWTWCCYVDLAIGENSRSDWNAALPITLAPESGDLIVRDMLHIQQLDKFLKFLKESMLKPENHHVIWGIEATAFQTQIWKDFLADRTLAAVAIKKMVPNESKEDRITRVSLRAKDGKFGLIRGPWNLDAKKQLMEYPHGGHDDIADSIAGGLWMIAEIGKVKESRIL